MPRFTNQWTFISEVSALSDLRGQNQASGHPNVCAIRLNQMDGSGWSCLSTLFSGRLLAMPVLDLGFTHSS